MLDYDLIRIFRPIIINGLSELGINAQVLVNYQPTKQGINDNTVYFFTVNDRNIGHINRLSYWDSDAGEMVYKEVQSKQTTYQINTVLKQDPNNLDITAKDLCTYVNMILQSKKTIDALAKENIGILWISEIRNVPFLGSDENYEFNPSFDFTLTYNIEIGGEISKIDNFNCRLERI